MPWKFGFLLKHCILLITCECESCFMLLRYIEICSKITLKNDRLNDLAQYIFKKMFYYRDEVTYQFGEKKEE